MTSTIAASGPPAAAGKNGDHSLWTRKDLWIARAHTIFFSALIGIGEVVFGQLVLLAIVRDANQAWLLAYVFVIAANSAAYFAAVKVYTSKLMAAGLGLAWLALGTTLVFLRIKESQFVEQAVEVGTSSSAAAAATAELNASHLLIAAVLAAFYLTGGVLTFIKAYGHSNPALVGHITAVKRHQKALKRYVKVLGNSHHGTQQPAQRLVEIDEVPEDLRRHKASIATGIARAKHAARVRLAEKLGDVTATTGLTEPSFSEPQHDPGVPANDGPDAGEEETPAR